MTDRMTETYLIFAEELRRSARRVGFVLATLAVPTILVLILVGVLVARAIVDGGEDDDEESPRPTGIVNLSRGVHLPAGGIVWAVIFPDRQFGIDALLDDSISELYVIPGDYAQSGTLEWLTTGEGAFAAFDPGPGNSSAARITSLLRTALAVGELPQDVLTRALVPAIFERTRIGDDKLPIADEEEFEFARFVLGFGGAFMLLFATLISGSSLVQSVAEEKENRMIEILLTSAGPFSVMAGKVLAIGLSSLVQMVVWVGSLVIIVPLMVSIFPDGPAFDVDPLLLAVVFTFFVGGYFLSSVLLAGIGAASPGVKEASQVSVIVLLPLILPFWFMGSLLTAPDGALATTLSLFPLTAPLTMLLRVSLGEPSVGQILLSGSILFVSGALLLWVSARVFRAGLLLYGQRMTPGQMLNALRRSGN